LKAYRRKKGTAPKGFENLQKEVQNGVSLVILNGVGEVERVVSVVALRVEREDNKLFVQLAKWEHRSGLSVSVALPGGKQERQEHPLESVNRFHKTKLSAIKDAEIQHMQREVTTKMSKDYGIKTKYYRTVYFARLELPFTLNTCIEQDSVAASHVLTDLSRRPSSASASSFTNTIGKSMLPSHQAELLDSLSTVPAYFIPNRSDDCAPVSGVFYAWLSLEDFETMKAPSNEDVLTRWLSRFDPQEIIELDEELPWSALGSIRTST